MAQAAKLEQHLLVPEALVNRVPEKKQDTSCMHAGIGTNWPPAWTLLLETKPWQERVNAHHGAAAGSATPPKHSSCGDPCLKTAKQTPPPSFGFTLETLVHSWKLRRI